MNRIKIIQQYANNIFDQIPSPETKSVEIGHCYGVAQCSSLLAVKRGLDKELAYIAGLLHDIYRSKTGFEPYHSHNGAEMLRVVFQNELAGVFTAEEQTTIKSAVYHHSDKTHVHDVYDELLKDSDALQHFLFAADGRATSYEVQRLNAMLRELSFEGAPCVAEESVRSSRPAASRRDITADIAESLAAKKITGDRTNADYMRLIRYFPEESAFDELKNGWCAAFVYHCCLEAGLHLPIRVHQTAGRLSDYRLACVRAWYEWGSENGFCHTEKEGFTPVRGDIVIYNNIIPKENKKESSFWGDHIGIVLSAGMDELMVAEGNVGNQNVSGIVQRRRDDTVGCYLRIPDDYVYDGWKTDYKTGEIRIVDLAGQEG